MKLEEKWFGQKTFLDISYDNYYQNSCTIHVTTTKIHKTTMILFYIIVYRMVNLKYDFYTTFLCIRCNFSLIIDRSDFNILPNEIIIEILLKI